MRAALEEARNAAEAGEIPVGAVIVRAGAVIARAHNRNRRDRNPLLHAEMIAIEIACRAMGNERLIDCDLYVTKEPCAMCAGALVHARLRAVYIGARDVKYGACGTVLAVCGSPALNHRPAIEFGLLEQESTALLGGFFKRLRNHHTKERPE